MSEEKKITIDARGQVCPLPVVRAKEAATRLGGEGTVEVIVDNEIAVQNLNKLAQNRGYTPSVEKKEENEYVVTLTLDGSENSDSQDNPADYTCGTDATRSGITIIFDSDCVGEGADKLGHILAKSFIFALTKQDVLPQNLVFYNSGAFLTSADSEVLEDLKLLEGAGVQIHTCGTCMDFYNITDKLAVGKPTNMYEIVEILEHSASVIRP